MHRRTFIGGTAALTGVALLGRPARLLAASGDAKWREFQVTYRVALADGPSPKRLWVPLPQEAAPYQRVASAVWETNADGAVALKHDETYQAPILCAEWNDPKTKPTATVNVRVSTRDRSVDPKGRAGPRASAAELALYRKPTRSMPDDGIVRETALKITAGKTAQADKARAIYEWVVDNTFRNPKTRGCGLGDIRFMLESGDLGGKCADINALYVGLARAAGLPAREVYGIRVADSASYKSLGKSGDITKAQHCRAEVYLDEPGWVPVDPADVRKVVLEEPLPLDHPRTVAARRRLFGSWEMNWVGFNYARDFRLPGQAGDAVSFLMYPYAEAGGKPLDHLDPATFKYEIEARELTT